MTQLFKAKPFIIAEVGSNWTCFNEAKDSISFAKNCGADAVKFQAFTESDLFGPGIRDSTSEEKSAQHRLPLDWIPKLKEKSDACGIELMCSAFSTKLYDFVDQYVGVHKIASSELTHPDILEKVKSFKKPIIMSVGASSKGDVARAMQILRGGPQVVLMYCSASYPSTQYNLFYMQDLADMFQVPVGFSDHSIDVVYPALSAVHHFGAVAIEKHVNFTKHHTPDSGHSLSHDEFALMCQFLKGKRDYKSFNPMPEEKDMFLKHNRRLIATVDIGAGDQFVYGQNFGAYRSLKEDSRGLIAFEWEEIAKRCANRFIKAGEGICLQDCL